MSPNDTPRRQSGQESCRFRQQAANRRRLEVFMATWTPRKQEIEWLYHHQGMYQKEIAVYFGVTQSIISMIMKRLGIAARKRVCGPKHYNWKGGLHNRDYRKLITKDRCALCGTTENLGIHHKNDDHFDNQLENLQVLCNPCHMSETKRKWWAAKKAGLPTPKSNGPIGWERKAASQQ